MIPTIVGVSLLFFSLKQCIKTDPVLERGEGLEGMSSSIRAAALQQRAKKIEADLPAFYFNLTTAAQSDTLYRIFPVSTRKRLAALTAETGHWPAVQQYERHLEALTECLHDSLENIQNLRSLVSEMHSTDGVELLKSQEQLLKELLAHQVSGSTEMPTGVLEKKAAAVCDAIDALANRRDGWKNNLPALHWYGTTNQYHRWLAGFFSGNLGTSVVNYQPVSESLYIPLRLTLFINGLALLLALLLSVPLGIFLVKNAGRKRAAMLRTALVAFYTTPVFWLGTWLILLFATQGMGLSILPGLGMGTNTVGQGSFFAFLFSNVERLILPVATLVLHSLAIFTFQMQGALSDTFRQPFIQAARAKGLTEKQVFWRHVFPNALSPVISLVVAFFPTVITGSLVIDFLFYLPGMGSKTQEAFMNGDIPVLAAILMLIALFTVMSQFLADILYKRMDARIQYQKD